MNESARQFNGIYPAVVTPYTPDGKVNVDAFKRIVEFDIQQGASGFWVCGGTGESVLLEDDERIALAEAAVQQARGRAKIIFHVGALTTARSVRLAKAGEKAGVDAVCSVTPFFYTPSPQGIVDHYKAIQAACGLPFFVYNLPGATNVEVTIPIMEQIVRDVPQTVGLKHSGRDVFAIRAFADMGLAAFTGHSGLVLSALVLGAVGNIDGPPCVAPELYVRVYEAYKAGDMAGAQQAMKKAASFTALCHRPGFIGVVKALIEARLGIDCGAPRAPLPSLTAAEKKQVVEQAQKLGVIKALRAD